MKMDLLDLYRLLGDNAGISFTYGELPDNVVVTIGFSLKEKIDEDIERSGDAKKSATESGEPDGDGVSGWGGRKDLH